MTFHVYQAGLLAFVKFLVSYVVNVIKMFSLTLSLSGFHSKLHTAHKALYSAITRVYVLPLRAVAVHAAISRLSAGLPVHGRPSPRVLHGHTRLHTPLDAAAAGLTHLLACCRLCDKHREDV